uniref:DUF7597 domain-containing protein n=1 Tax=Setaria viridis TaxID=4556 RepID=A0A4U6VPK2_SETVI|nr:hypothetical protein SEVIR_2G080300v2 [Setaria viridis]
MAYKFVDPTPFLPRGSQRQLVGFRKPMSRVILGAPRRNQCDVAIATIEPLPHQQVSFQSIRDMLDDFLRNRCRMGVHSIQPCPYGQAYVRFQFVHEKDFLIGGGPHEYGQYRISFSDHNKGWNNRLITMNCEVWIMLLGFNIDYWTKADLEKAIAEFGRLLVWEEDPNNLARIIAKIRVVDLSEIPWFLVCSEGEDFEGNSWTAQCEILQYRMLGGGNANLNANQPVNQEPAPQWGLWPDGPKAQDNGPFIGPQISQEDPVVPIVQALPALNPVNHGQGEEEDNPDFDLNMAIADDLGGIDNLAPLDEEIEEAGNDVVNNQVIEGSDNSDNELPIANQVMEHPVHVEVFIPQADGQPVQMVQDEINENDLMGGNQDQDIQLAEENNNFMHLGYVEVMQPSHDPVFAQMESLYRPPSNQPSAEFYRQWATHFSSASDEPKVEVPISWASFFMAQLITPGNFEWAKNFLSSPAMQYLESDQFLNFSIPMKCPYSAATACAKEAVTTTADNKGKGIIFEGSDKSLITSSSASPFTTATTPQSAGPGFPSVDSANNTQSSPVTPVQGLLKKVAASSGPWSKSLLQQASMVDKVTQDVSGNPLSDDELRRSSKTAKHNNGFKASGCKDRNCIGCSVKPPLLSQSVIRNLGASFSKIESSKLLVVALNKKSKPAAPPGGRKPAKKKADKNEADNVPKDQKKKPRK